MVALIHWDVYGQILFGFGLAIICIDITVMAIYARRHCIGARFLTILRLSIVFIYSNRRSLF
jgi:hypothetical protein